VHELSAWRDHIGIKFELTTDGTPFLKWNLICPFSLDRSFTICIIFEVLGDPESTRSLLIHLGSRRYTVNCEVNKLARPGQSDYLVSVLIDILKNLCLGLRLRITVARMGARMDNTIHVEVQIINFWVLCCNLLSQSLIILFFLEKSPVLFLLIITDLGSVL
jgi:hypothetical protein